MNYNNLMDFTLMTDLYTVYEFTFDESNLLAPTIQEVGHNFISFNIYYNYNTSEILPLEKILKYISNKQVGNLMIHQYNTIYTPTPTNNNSSNIKSEQNLLYTYVLRNFKFTSIKNILSHEVLKFGVNNNINKLITVNFEYDDILFLKNNKIEQRINKINEILGDENINPWYQIKKDIINP